MDRLASEEDVPLTDAIAPREEERPSYFVKRKTCGAESPTQRVFE